MATTTALLVVLMLAPVADPENLETRARAFVTALEKGKFAEAVADYDAAMLKALPLEKTEATWKAVVGQVGALEKQLGTRNQVIEPYRIVFVTCKFAKATLDVRVVFDKQDKISGLSFRPAETTDNFPVPAYARRDSFQETQVKVGVGDWQLPGTLSLPKGAGPFPGVVLVHGSGPQDRDETIGLLKPFRDLAWGLASKGIAVLRYEKRTKEHGAKFATAKDFTVKEETIEDALLAAELLRKTPGIDAQRVFIAGHSQGAMMAPRMVLEDKNLAGIIMMASPSRPLEDVLLEQTKRVLERAEPPGEQERKVVETLQAVARLIKDGKLNADTPRAQLMNFPPAYWQSLYGFTVVPDALKLKVPILILQGEKDVQVTMTDFAGWQTATKGLGHFTLKSYPKLGHTFTPSSGSGDPKELAKPANVAAEVIADIIAWIKAGK